jgi:hypothetical protein
MLLLVVACGGDAPLAPAGSVTLEELSPSEVADLHQQEQAELARLEARRVASADSLDALGLSWSATRCASSDRREEPFGPARTPS